jgi:hypothetical protein
MYQLAFAGSENSDDDYLLYLIDFFDERKIDYVSDVDANLRIGVFIDYIDFNFDKSELDRQKLESIKMVYGRYIESTKSFRTLIKKMIANDDFLNIILRRGKETFYTDVVKEEKSIFDIIHIIDQGKTFENYIKMLCLLNNRFMLETPNKTKRGLLERPQSDIVLKDTVEREKAISNLDIIPTYYSTNLDDYLRLINREKRNDLTWYRGICNVNYSLIPSLYVHLPDGTIPYCFQNALIRQSYDETKKNYHVFSKHEFPSAIRQSLMQHYGVPTNLLDFSTDPLASLYWALNPDNEKDKNVYCSAVVYVFHPHKYQKACNIIQNHHKCKGKKICKIELCNSFA